MFSSWQNKRHHFRFSNSLSAMRDVSFVTDRAVLDFELGRRGTHVNSLVRQPHELVEIERAIVQRARQTEAVIYEHGLAGAIAFVHPADLWNAGVRFIDDGEEIVWKKIDYCVGPRARCAAGQVARIIFNPITRSEERRVGKESRSRWWPKYNKQYSNNKRIFSS